MTDEEGDSGDTYLTHPEARTLRGMLLAIDIFARNLPAGLDTKYGWYTGHEILFGPCDDSQIPKNSEDGKLLTTLGWHIDDDSWAMFT
ncbi:MAG: hypothetical protein WC091_02590 [Sulfuricellaceae bacterium]